MAINKIQKIVVLIVFFLSIKCLSQEFDTSGYIQLDYNEYQELIKNGASSNLNGNFSIIRRGKEGKVINLEIKHYKDGKKTGEWISYHNLFVGLRLSFVANYKDDKLHGYYFRTDNHTFSEKGFYKNDKKHGEWEISKDGELKEYTYKNGVKHGFFKVTNEIDEVSEGYYKKGKKDGKYKEVFETITKIGQYKNDMKSGIWTIEDTITGETTKEVYKDGKLISSN